MDNRQQSSTYRLCRDRHEMINHIISKCTKPPQNEVKDLVRLNGKGDPLGIVTEIKFDPNTKLYIHKPESIQERKTHKILWNFEIQTDHLILAKRHDLILRSWHFVDLAVPVYHRVKKKRKRKDIQILEFCKRAVKMVDHEGNGDTNCNWCTGNSPQKFGRKTEGIRNQRKNWDHPDYSKIGRKVLEYSEKSLRLQSKTTC